jgi:hypothetical protein
MILIKYLFLKDHDTLEKKTKGFKIKKMLIKIMRAKIEIKYKLGGKLFFLLEG